MKSFQDWTKKEAPEWLVKILLISMLVLLMLSAVAMKILEQKIEGLYVLIENLQTL